MTCWQGEFHEMLTRWLAGQQQIINICGGAFPWVEEEEQWNNKSRPICQARHVIGIFAREKTVLGTIIFISATIRKDHDSCEEKVLRFTQHTRSRQGSEWMQTHTNIVITTCTQFEMHIEMKIEKMYRRPCWIYYKDDQFLFLIMVNKRIINLSATSICLLNAWE